MKLVLFGLNNVEATSARIVIGQKERGELQFLKHTFEPSCLTNKFDIIGFQSILGAIITHHSAVSDFLRALERQRRGPFT